LLHSFVPAPQMRRGEPAGNPKRGDSWLIPKIFHGIPRIIYRGRQISMLGNLFATLPTARRCRRGPDRRHTERGERRAAHSVPAIGIAILRRVAAPIASVPGQFRPGNIRHSGGPMRSCCNREHHSERPAVRTSRRCSDTFERAATSGITGSPSASGNPRRAVESLRLAGLSRLLPPGRFGLSDAVCRRSTVSLSLPAVDLLLASTLRRSASISPLG